MKKGGSFKEIWPVLFLGIVVCISVALLNMTGNITRDQIEKEKIKAIKMTLKDIFSDMEDFREVEGIEGTYLILDSSGDNIGVGIMCVGKGYGGDLNMIAGIDMNWESINNTDLDEIPLKGIKIVEPISETPGLGAKVLDTDFQSQFEGMTYGDIALDKDGGSIDAITGATISSKAVVDGVRNDIEDKINRLKEVE